MPSQVDEKIRKSKNDNRTDSQTQECKSIICNLVHMYTIQV